MDILFLLKSDFLDPKRDKDGIHYYCPDCAFLEGVLFYYPLLRSQLDIRYIDYPHPRQPMIELLGEGQYGCPHLILDKSNEANAEAMGFNRKQDRWHTQDNKLIASYLTATYGIGIAHY